MWKAILLGVAALLSTAQGWEPGYQRAYGGRTGVESWDQLLAELMQNSPRTGACDSVCYVTIGGETEVLERNSEPVVFSEYPCTSYSCTSAGVKTTPIKCLDDSEIICPSGVKLIQYPGKCCKQCEGQNKPPGEWSEWGEWTDCSVSCGGGRRARRRECQVSEDDTHVECTGALQDTEDCNDQDCPIDCEWEYSSFGQCSATCGFGTMTRTPIILVHPENGGRPCPPEAEVPDSRECKIADCPTPCEWEYGPFEECSVSCGGGIKKQYPRITKPATNGGFCPLHVLEGEPNEDDCNTQHCPAPCVWRFGSFGECSVSCGGGTKIRFPEVVTPAMHGGSCNLPDPEEMACNTQSCPTPCEWEYGPFEECSVSCGGGIKKQYPRITKPATNGGFCPPHVLEGEPNEDDCNTQSCPVPCVWRFGSFGECSVPCGGGIKRRFPEVVTPAQHGGSCNLPDPEEMPCNTHSCPVDCVWRWGEYGDCSVTCEQGIRIREPVITSFAMHGGTCNLPEPETETCTVDTPCMRCEEGENACPNRRGVYRCIPDMDGDCVNDNSDNCIAKKNADQSDQDRDGVGDVCDNCQNLPNPLQGNADGDLRGDACDEDDDNDGVDDKDDNCIYDPNSRQRDSDNDGVGDACDNCMGSKNTNQNDDDKDGIGNKCDNCRYVYNPQQLASDCTVNEMAYYDDDDDDDNVMNESEKNSLAAQIMEKLLELYYSN